MSDLFHLRLDVHKIQEFIFSTPILKYMLGANSCIGELFSQDFIALMPPVKNSFFPKMKVAEEIDSLFQKNILSSAGGHFEGNDLIHKGKSAVKIEKRILKFIQIDPADMQKAIQHLSNKDLDALIQFESKCWNNGFFQPLRQIAEKPDKDYVLPLRRLSKTYAELVLNL